jgi:quercetin 2,3-dioxygenase
VNASQQLRGEAQVAVLSPDGERVHLDVNQDAVLLVLKGEPINEPVARYGPFVLNTRAEVMQAVADYQAGKMGNSL